MRTFLSSLILPLPVFWLLLFAAGLFLFRRKQRAAACTAALAVLWLLASSTPFLPDALLANLENQYQALTQSRIDSMSFSAHAENPIADLNTHILVLGCGHSSDPRLPANDQLSVQALGRLAEGIRIHRMLPGSTLITSGSRVNDPQTRAAVLADAALLLGVGKNNIRQQGLPSNTMEEAQEYKRLFGDTAPLILVTTAMHMPRAMYAFEKTGLQPIPAPTNHIIKCAGKDCGAKWWPSAGNISKMERAIHEYAGLLYYRLFE